MSAGELAPDAYGRVDIARYPNAVKKLVNVIPRTLGGAQKRPGTEFIAETKNSAARSKLIPYIVGRDEAYMIEFGNLYARFYKPDGTQIQVSGSPYEIVTPYTTAMVSDLDYTQAEDAMYLFHGDVTPHRLKTSGEASWSCLPAPFTTTPFAEQGDYPAVTLMLSSNTIGTGRTATAASAYWLPADVGRAILCNAGVAVITAYTSDVLVTVEIKSIFDSASIASGEWNLDSSPQAKLTPQDLLSDKKVDAVGEEINLTLEIAGWRSSDVGKFVRINGGLVQIITFTSSTVVVGTIITVMTAVVAAPALSWTLESALWNSRNGHPWTGTMHDQRLVAAGTYGNPQTVFGSRIGEPLDFTIGVADDDAFNFPIDSTQTNQIAYVIGTRNLLVLTYGGEFAILSGTEKPVTPTNVQVKPQSPHGSRRVRPVIVGKEVLFVQRAGKKLRSIGYKFEEDGYKSADLTTLSSHITGTGIACMAFQQEPDPVVWCALNNGKLISLTLDRDLDVVAWAGHETEGAVESIASMPYGDSEQVWKIYRRNIGGTVKRYIERLQPDWYPIYGQENPDLDAIPPEDEAFKWGFTLDCALTQDDAAGKTVWDGFDHLEGKTLRCIADGVDMPTAPAIVVTGGQIELPRPAKRILAGLMFKPRIETLPPEIQGAMGSIQGDAISANKLAIRVNNTISAIVNGNEAIPGRYNGAAQLDSAPALFSGDAEITNIGWTNGNPEVVIEQDNPFPFHVLAIIRTVTVNGG